MNINEMHTTAKVGYIINPSKITIDMLYMNIYEVYAN